YKDTTCYFSFLELGLDIHGSRFIAHMHVTISFGKHCMSHTGRFFRDRWDGLWMQRHLTPLAVLIVLLSPVSHIAPSAFSQTIRQQYLNSTLAIFPILRSGTCTACM